jgi:acetyl esterase/lipase
MIHRTIAAIVVFLGALAIAAGAHAAPPATVPVWPNLDPALKSSEKVEDHGKPGKPAPFVRDIQYPTMSVYTPEGATAPTAAVLVCPGGGYAGVSVEKEGTAVARWLNSIGAAGIVLRYRMPRVEETGDGTPLPLLDAREALRLARLHASEWNLDPKRIGIMGFSAGGHLASTVITHPADDAAARADFAVLVYPVISMADGVAHAGSKARLIGEKPDAKQVALYSNELQVSERTVPTFLVHAGDDKVSPMNSLLFYQALRAHHVPAELHLFEQGGHGFGLGVDGGAVAAWPGLCEKWLRTRQILPKE